MKKKMIILTLLIASMLLCSCHQRMPSIEEMGGVPTAENDQETELVGTQDTSPKTTEGEVPVEDVEGTEKEDIPVATEPKNEEGASTKPTVNEPPMTEPPATEPPAAPPPVAIPGTVLPDDEL